jgi:hypothetical protein
MTTSTTVIPAVAGDGIEAAIRREHAAATTAANAALGHALECGRLLAEARQGIEHGGWETFVRERCDIAPRTARVYLRLHANRERLADRQRVAGLTVREAVRLLTEPKPESEQPASAGEAFDYLGQSYCSLTSTACTFNPEWQVVPFPMIAEAWSVAAPTLPSWYAAGHRHAGHHPTGWSFEVTPDPLAEGRVNVIAHDAEGTLHLATFDGTSPAGILPFLTACERHHGMPAIGDDWTVTGAAVPPAVARLAQPFPMEIFRLAGNRGHRCCCWMLLDVVLGIDPIGEKNLGWVAWRKLGDALAVLVHDLGEGAIPGVRRRKPRQGAPA